MLHALLLGTLDYQIPPPNTYYNTYTYTLFFFFLLQGCDAGDELDTLTTTRGPEVSRGSVISTPNTTTHQLIAIACSSMNASMCTADGLVACQWDEDHALCAPHCSALPK